MTEKDLTTDNLKDESDRTELESEYDNVGLPLMMDGYDDCIIGVMRRFGQDPPLVAYDYDKVIAHGVRNGMTHDEAVEYFDYNQIGAWMGDGTPCFVYVGEDPEELIS